MSNNNNIKQFRVDAKVVNLFLLLVICGGGLLGFKYYNYQPCPAIDFSILGNNHKVNSMIKFQNNITGKHDFLWDFGDSTQQAIRRSPIHIYKNSGTYHVTLLIDGSCVQTQSITLSEIKIEKPNMVQPKILGPGSIYADKEISLTCNVQDCISYQWYIDNDRNPVSFRKDLKYAFKTPGYKVVTLVVNGDLKQKTSKRIYVRLPQNNALKEVVAEVTEEPEEPMEKFIPQTPVSYDKFEVLKNQETKLKYLPPDEELQVMFSNILKGKTDKTEFADLLCTSSKELVVISNGKVLSFDDLLEEMKGIEYVLKEFSTTRNENKCISKLKIRYRRKKNFLNL